MLLYQNQSLAAIEARLCRASLWGWHQFAFTDVTRLTSPHYKTWRPWHPRPRSHLHAMTSNLAQKVGLSLFEKHLQQYTPEDPVYETYTDKKGRTRTRRVRRAICLLLLRLTEHGLLPARAPTRAISARCQDPQKGQDPRAPPRQGLQPLWVPFRVHILRRYASIAPHSPSFLLLTVKTGLVPGVGDVADAALNYGLVVRKSRQAEIPDWLLRRMLLNNAISAAVGFVPVAGDVFIATYKANSRNAALLEEFLRIRGEQFLKSQNRRTEDEGEVMPGAGRVQGEKVPGKKTSLMSWGTRKRAAA